MKHFPLVILMLNPFCAFSQILHEITYIVGCMEHGASQVQYEFDTEEILYADFEKKETQYTSPKFVGTWLQEILTDAHVYRNAVKGKNLCTAVLPFIKAAENNPPEEKDPPQSVVYPEEEAQLGVENTLICFVNHFYPPKIRVNWTKNGDPVSEGVSLSRYFPNKDQTFHQFSTLIFTPSEGDIYSCTVEHLALEAPITRIWEPELSHPSLGPDIFCGVGLTVGLLGVAAGTFLMVKGYSGFSLPP